MLSADEANKRSKELSDKYSTEEVQDTEKLINKAINEGKYSVIINGILKTKTKLQLEQLGYKIEVGGRLNERDTIIQW
jgi:hypothetical protein